MELNNFSNIEKNTSFFSEQSVKPSKNNRTQELQLKAVKALEKERKNLLNLGICMDDLSIISMGSTGRNERTKGSDVEYVFVIKDDVIKSFIGSEQEKNQEKFMDILTNISLDINTYCDVDLAYQWDKAKDFKEKIERISFITKSQLKSFMDDEDLFMEAAPKSIQFGDWIYDQEVTGAKGQLKTDNIEVVRNLILSNKRLAGNLDIKEYLKLDRLKIQSLFANLDACGGGKTLKPNGILPIQLLSQILSFFIFKASEKKASKNTFKIFDSMIRDLDEKFLDTQFKIGKNKDKETSLKDSLTFLRDKWSELKKIQEDFYEKNPRENKNIPITAKDSKEIIDYVKGTARFFKEEIERSFPEL